MVIISQICKKKKKDTFYERSYRMSIVIHFLEVLFELHTRIVKSKLCLNYEIQLFLICCLETRRPHPKVLTTHAAYSNVHKEESTDRKQSVVMIGIAVALFIYIYLFIVLAIFYTYRLENSNKETGSNIYYCIK